jgi:3-mercaptopyruvate sulfurtransferase SseA
MGITRVHPLVGGWHGWKKNGFPMVMPKESIQQTAVSIQN